MCDDSETTAGDYSVMIKNIPHNFPPSKYKKYEDYIKKSVEAAYGPKDELIDGKQVT